MKKHLSVITSLLLSMTLNAQISIKKNTDVASKSFAYDSLSNFSYKFDSKDRNTDETNSPELSKYIGQSIFFIPFSEGVEIEPVNFEQFKFYSNEPSSIKIKNISRNKIVLKKTKTVQTNIYHANSYVRRAGFDEQNIIYTPVKAYQGKYFKILDIKFEKIKKYGINSDSLKMILLDENKKELILKSEAKFWNNFWRRYPPFIIIGFYEKIQKYYIGKDFIYDPKNQSIKSYTDANTGKSIYLNKRSEWKCLSLDYLDVEDRFLRLHLLLENNKGEKIQILINEKDELPLYSMKSFVDKEEYLQKEEEENLRVEANNKLAKQTRIKREKEKKERKEAILKKYGNRYGKLINEGKVVIGMPSEVCRLAWGAPNKINRTTVAGGVHEQWVYDDRYLYMENGKLTAIQD